jgi:aspartate/methionine/tyrosine aminotransferase
MAGDEGVPFPYMRWAKRHLTAYAPSNLGMSGIASVSTTELPYPPDVPYWAPEGERGDPELRALLGARYGVDPEGVFVSAGSSLANFLVYLAEARGGHVAAETPAYESLLRTPEAVGATVAAFRRDESRGWRLDAASLEKAARPGTKLLVVSDLHNPTGARLHRDDLALLLDHARRRDAAVLVDEVYLELATEPARTAALADPRVLITNSLTKSHGLGGLRVGWVLGHPDRIRRLAEWNDLVCPAHPVPSIVLAKRYLPDADRFLARTRAAIAPRLAQADAWVRSRRDVSWVTPAGGITGFLRLPPGTSGDALSEHAMTAHAVRVIPGSFFQAPGHVRISYGLAEGDLARALESLGHALDDLARR